MATSKPGDPSHLARWHGGSASLVAIGRYLSLGLSLFTATVIARALGPVGRGVTATMLAVWLVTTVLVGLGVPLAMRRRVAESGSAPSIVAAGRLFALSTLPVSLLVGVICALTLFTQYGNASTIAFLVAMGIIPLAVSWAQDVSVLVAAAQFTKIAFLGAVSSIAFFCMILGMWLSGNLVIPSVLYAHALSNVAAFVVGIMLVRGGRGTVREALSIAREGLSLVGAQLADTASRRIDQIIALPLIGAHQTGLYSVGSTVAQLSSPLAQATSAAMYKDMVGSAARTNDAVGRVIRHALVIAIPTTLLLIAGGALTVPIIFGEAFRPAVPATVILSLATPFTMTAFAVSQWMAAQRRGQELTVIQLVGLGVTVITLTIGGILWDAQGVATGTTIGSIVTALMLMARACPSPRLWRPHLSDVRPAWSALFGARTPPHREATSAEPS